MDINLKINTSNEILQHSKNSALRNAMAIFPLEYTVLYPEISLIILISVSLRIGVNYKSN